MAMRKVIRVAFREGVNMPGDGITRGGTRQIVGGTTETLVPPRGMVGAKLVYDIGFSDGLIVVTHPGSRIAMRYPMSMVKEVTFEEDVPAEKKA